ncbi:MAG: ATP-dependent DNA helicase RecG [Pseudopedobacter saltans]|uniref:ATP-dependent DNA helicase RecG n=1 Tax=Pseudopedobacter saltans TaxID=151895 RepID=A0A2W5GL24_9SPHI|nr:MAG: ATP-dependent DNA helicase RecG [Pseudopedobacter saltans]
MEHRGILDTPIEYLKGVGPLRGDMLRKEIQLFTFRDLLTYFPLRHIDRTRIDPINQINFQSEYIQVAGKITQSDIIGERRSKRLVAYLSDGTGEIELVWFQGINWIQKSVTVGARIVAFGKVSFFNGKPQISHPEIETTITQPQAKQYLEPIYPSTEKLKARGINSKLLSKIMEALFVQLKETDIPENLPEYLLSELRLMPRFQAFVAIHFPKNEADYQAALRRLKFEELFLAQLRLALIRIQRHRNSKGFVFEKVGELFNTFYEQYLPFELTNAQKRVLKEIRQDTGKGFQMNRLVQGDVGSGKTIVALLSMILAADNGFQSCLMAPTEILARQHFQGLSELLKDLPINIRILTGSTKIKERREILAELENGNIHLLVGTHAIIEDKVQFKNIGLAVVDEQHKFGVAQRAKLWKKNSLPPHILVMTATPIPRTLAMTAYGDLDYSVIDELPPGRKPILTVHRNEMQRASVMDFIKSEIKLGRQAYIIYPLIEESEKLSYEDLMQGYEQVKSYFPEPKYLISMVHGRQTAEEKSINMQRFVQGNTQIMVSTTVIEVGVNVPNASVMAIESTEKFGLSQLHQLRGRVGRGSEKSYCILITGSKLSNDARERVKIMCATNDGFKIAEKDLELRGPGDIEGTRQSGALNFKIASIVDDKPILEAAKFYADKITTEDEKLDLVQHSVLKQYLMSQKGKTAWSKIS